MLQIGLTGGIGSGKSTIAKVFEVLGIPVYNADEAAKRLMNQEGALMNQIITHFGPESYFDGKLNRAFIANLVFADQEKLQLLNSLTHPAVLADGMQWAKEQQGPYSIREAALIFESGIHQHLDYVIGVSAPESLRISRAMARDEVGRDEVLRRMSNQMPEDEKMKRCDFVIFNDELQLVLPQVLALHRKWASPL